jgi:hypothetical protein
MSNCYDKKGQQTKGCYVGVTGGDECGMNSKMRFGCPKGGVPRFMAPLPGSGPVVKSAGCPSNPENGVCPCTGEPICRCGEDAQCGGVEKFALLGTVRPSCYFPGGPSSDVGVGI